MRRLAYLFLVGLLALAVATPALAAPGKGGSKPKAKTKPAATRTERGASGQSAHATGSRGIERAREAQTMGQGQEHRGFEQPAGLEKKDTTTSGAEKAKGKSESKGKQKETSKSKSKQKPSPPKS